MKKLNNIILRCLPFLGLLLLLLVPNAAYAQTPVEDDAAAVTLTVLAPPSFTFCPPGSDLGCNPASVPAPGAATATGGCPSITLTSALGGITNTGCQRSQTRTYTATDGCGNTATCTQVFTWTVDPPVVLTCPVNTTTTACQTQAAVNAAFSTWLATATFTGGCNGVLTNNNTGAPSFCGGSTTVTFTVTSACQASSTCQATFTVPNAPAPSLACPTPLIRPVCQTRAQDSIAMQNWVNTSSFSGGCNGSINFNGFTGNPPSSCGGTKTLTLTYTSGCAAPLTCTSTFTIPAPTAPVLTCPANQTQPFGQTQAQINAAFATWLTTASGTGVCNGVLSNNNVGAPPATGGSTTVTFTYSQSPPSTPWSGACPFSTLTCQATFTVSSTPPVVLTCPVNTTTAACQTQAAVNMAFSTWLATASGTGGCNGVLTNNNTGAPAACGGSTTVTFSYTSTCAPLTTTCQATFTVAAPPPVSIICPVPTTVASCQTQAAINAQYAAWLATFNGQGGCNLVGSDNGNFPPSNCGEVKTVTFTLTSTCAPSTTSCQSTFTVSTPPPVVLTCPVNTTVAACQTQAAVNTAFATWLATATASGGCNGGLTNNNTGAPSACGGSTTVTFTRTSSCAPTTTTCQATFTVPAAPPVVLICPTNTTTAACQTQAAVNTAFSTWLATATASGGCNGGLTNNNTGAPSACGGSTTVTFTYTSSCAPTTTTCQATFTVAAAPPVVLTCPTNTTAAACQTQAAVNTAFATWLATATASGGCNGGLTNNNTGAPSACGGSTTVTFTYTSTCAPTTTTCQATFTVPTAPPVVLTCPTNTTAAACQTQAAVNTAFATWLATATASGGCNGGLTNNNTGAPAACGGSTTVTFTYTSSCAPLTTTCQATFTVPTAPPVVLTCPTNTTTAACQTQAAVNTAFATWLTTASASGGCNGGLTNNNTGAPSACGGSTTVTFTYTSSCAPLTTTCQATFTVPTAPPVVLTCPTNTTTAACQTQAAVNTAFATWLATATASGGCNGGLTNNNTGAPSACGGSTTVTFTYTSTCVPLTTTCQATFTVPTAPPVVLTCPTNTTAAACQTQAAVNAQFATWLATATASGGCNGGLTNNNTGAPSACGGSTTVTFTRTSSCAPLTTTCQAIFTVAAAPTVVLTCPTNTTTAACQTQAAVNTAFATWLATATANGGCNGGLTNNNTGAPSACGGSTTVTFTRTSSCAPLTTTCQATFTVAADVTAPTFTFCPPGSDLGINPPGVPAPGNANATDACSSPTITSALGTITSTGCQFSQTRTYTATDGCGNTATCTQLFTWITDVIPPTVVCQNATVSLNAAGAGSITTGDVFQSGADNCGTVNQVSVTPSSFTCANLGANTVTLLVNDGHGNTATCTATVTVVDNIAPTVVCQNATVSLNAAGTGSITTANVFQSGADNCGMVNQVSVTPNSFTCANLGANNVTLLVNDGHGNIATCTATVTVVDNILPTIVCPGNITQVTTNGECYAEVGFAPQIQDNCGVVNIEYNRLPNSKFDLGATSVQVNIADASGNTAQCQFWVFVVSAQEICDGLDNDCDGSIDEPDGFEYFVKELGINPVDLNQFGNAVALDSSRAIVGIQLDDQQGVDAGAAQIYERNSAGQWVATKHLIANDASAGDQFGHAVAIRNNWALVAAHLRNQNGVKTGAVYVYERNTGGSNNWGLVTTLTPSGQGANVNFGFSLAFDGRFAAVGSNFDSQQGTNAGAAYIFDANNAWAQVANLTALNGMTNDEFGHAVAIANQEFALVGAPGNDSIGLNAGAAYLFRRNATTGAWAQVKKLSAANTAAGDQFGFSVALDGPTAVVGAPRNDLRTLDGGIAYVFERNRGGLNHWGEGSKLFAYDSEAKDRLGSTVAVEGGLAVVGTPYENAKGFASGSANTYLRQGDGQWIIVQKLMDPSGNMNDNLFSSLALSNRTILAGAPRDDEQDLMNNGSVLWFDAQCTETGNMLIINDNGITQFENEFQEVSLKSPLLVYPVPFMSDVYLNFELAVPSESASVVITNAMGQVITSLHKGALSAGVHEMEWRTGESTPAGIYFLRIDAGAMQEVRRLIKVKE